MSAVCRHCTTKQQENKIPANCTNWFITFVPFAERNDYKMKVGLVPLLYNEYNYGGVLQFYALQRVLKNNNIDCEIIFFHNDEKILNSELTVWNKLLLKIKNGIFYFYNKQNNAIIEKNIKERKSKIDAFKKKYYVSVVDGDFITYSEYDAVVCGSDQIWNPHWARKRCFLEFVPDEVNKVIYAASFGCESLSETQKRQFKPRIQRLQHVSVREQSGKKILDSFIENNDIKVVLDPTLLLLSEEWSRIVVSPQLKGYVFTYFLGEYEDKIKYIKEFAQNKALEIVNIPFASGESVDLNRFGDVEIRDADPAEFLGLIRDADYIFRDSFHACVFSILFHKQFFVFKRDNKTEMFGRINTLLSNFDLSNRSITINTDINTVPKVDFTNVGLLQSDLREQSLAFLIEGLKNENKK